MQEIEYRAWDKVEQRMCRVYSVNCLRDGRASAVIASGKPPYNRFRKAADIELMQWTGLRDLKGVKIFVGDIMSARMGNSFGSQADEVSSVIFNDTWAMFQLQHPTQPHLRSHIPKNIEVIGNIYETPELLPA